MSGASTSRLVVASLAGAVALGALVMLARSEPVADPPKDEPVVDPEPVSGHTTRGQRRAIPSWLGEAIHEPGTPATPLRAARPSSGEGAPKAQLPPDEKADVTIAAVERAIEEIWEADAEEREELRELAAAKLSGVRAEMWATTEGKARYLELQSQLEEG